MVKIEMDRFTSMCTDAFLGRHGSIPKKIFNQNSVFTITCIRGEFSTVAIRYHMIMVSIWNLPLMLRKPIKQN